MSGGGVRTLRVPLFWPYIEPKPPEQPPAVPGAPVGLPEDRTRWGPTDEIVERAARHGIRVLPFVYGSPDWVAGGDFERPPIDDAEARAAWQDFLGDLVRRYGPGGEFWNELSLLEPGVEPLPITDWQIWNEANSPVFWHPRPSPAEYREVVALASEAIRAADPSATIVLGGMFGAPDEGHPSLGLPAALPRGRDGCRDVRRLRAPSLRPGPRRDRGPGPPPAPRDRRRSRPDGAALDHGDRLADRRTRGLRAGQVRARPEAPAGPLLPALPRDAGVERRQGRLVRLARQRRPGRVHPVPLLGPLHPQPRAEARLAKADPVHGREAVRGQTPLRDATSAPGR